MYAYEKKTKYSYNFNTYEELEYLCRKDKYDIPISKNTSVLGEKKRIKLRSGEKELLNSLTVHPMEGFDGNADGSPSELTKRRFLRFASSGAGLIWSEAISVVPEGRTSDRQLMLTRENLDEYKALISEMKKISDVPVIAQLTHSGRMSKNSYIKHPIFITRNAEYERVRGEKDTPTADDAYLDALPEKYALSASLAREAGFDGVDIKACHGYLLGESLSAYERKGKYGGDYENRTRLFKNCFDAAEAVLPDNMILGSRFGVSDMIVYPCGFGVTRDNPPKPDFTEAERLLSELMARGLSVIDMTMGSPYYNSYINRPANIPSVGTVPPEHPLTGLSRLISAGAEIKRALPSLFLIGTGYSYLKQLAMYAAAGALEKGYADAIGFGRMAFSYEGFARDFIEGKADEKKTCVSCGLCTKIMRAGGTTGCPLHDKEIYLPILRKYCMGDKK